MSIAGCQKIQKKTSNNSVHMQEQLGCCYNKCANILGSVGEGFFSFFYFKIISK